MTGDSALFLEMVGYAAALGSSMAWALGSVLFRKIGDFASPTAMNFGKCFIGLIYLGFVLLLSGIEPIKLDSFLFIGVSGIMGIAVGDTFFFKALVNLGPRLTVLLGTLGPILTVIIAVVFLEEALSGLTWLGAALTLAGVTLVLWEDAPVEVSTNKKWIDGLIYALLAALCMSLGIVTAKIAVAEVSPLQTTFIRILFAFLSLLGWGVANRNLGGWLTPYKDTDLLKLVGVAVFVVMFGGFWLSIVALKYIDASVATVLNSTEPLFVLPIVIFVLKEKVSVRSGIGALMAVIGVAIVCTR